MPPFKPNLTNFETSKTNNFMHTESNTNELFFGSILESPFEKYLAKYSDVNKVIFVDTNTHDYCLEYLLTEYTELMDAEVIALPAGEENKVIEVCQQVWVALSEYNIKRNDLVINLGGGLVTDMGGFIASIYKRGLNFINIPTSLLAMVDASTGGKTGVDLAQFKNQLGVFAFPELVICDPIFLQTLPEEEFLSGKAEMLKHALIANKKHWDKSKNITKDSVSIELIEDSVEIKQAIVTSDPYEKNERKKLNVGHTIGHAIEGFLLTKSPAPHGYCVAWGIVVEAYLSHHSGFLEENVYNEIKNTISQLYPKLPIEKNDLISIIALLQNDKKNENETINFNLIKAFGDVQINHHFEVDEIYEALNKLLVEHI